MNKKSLKSKSSMLPEQEQAAMYQATRRAHESEVAEDYVEIVEELIRTNGRARVIDIARRFGVSHAAVIKIVQRLQGEGLLYSEPYKSIELTESGMELALYCKERHALVVQFLIAIGVKDHIARIDAEGIEHHVSKDTLRAFRKFILSAP